MEGFVGRLHLDKTPITLADINIRVIRSPGPMEWQAYSKDYDYFSLAWLEHPEINDICITHFEEFMSCVVGLGYDQNGDIDSSYFLENRGITQKIKNVLRTGQDELDKNELNTLNGSFLIFVYSSIDNRLIVISDHFASRHFFYFIGNNYLCFASDLRVLLRLPEVNKDIDNRSLIEFLQLSTILENRTIYQEIKVLEPASYLLSAQEQTSVNKYWDWRFNYQDVGPAEQYTEELSNAFRKTTNRFIKTQDTTGLLLTGGLDSRMIAACIAEAGMRVKMITFADFENPETVLAKRVADHYGFDHNTLLRPPLYYSNIVEQSIEISNCLHSFSEAHLIGLQDNFTALGLSTLINGWGVDVFCNGSYIPQKHIHFIGRKLPINKMLPVATNDDLIQYILHKYSSSYDHHVNLFHEEALGDLWKNWSYHIIDKIANEITTTNAYDTIDYILFKMPSKFRSFLFPYSNRPYSRERCFLYNNDILEIYLKLPPKYRFNGVVYRKALANIDLKVLSIPYLKTGVPLNASQTYEQLSMIITPFIRGRGMQLERAMGKYKEYPAATYASSYPDLDILVRKVIGEKITNLLSLDTLYDLGCIDQQVVNRILEDHMSGNNNCGKLLINLSTLAFWFDRYGANSF